MKTQSKNWRGTLALVLTSSLTFSFVANAAEVDELRSVLANHTQGLDPDLSRIIAPALSLNTKLTHLDRVIEINERLLEELNDVMAAFKSAEDASKPQATRAAIAQFDRESAQDGAARTFEGNGPSLSVMRQVFFVPASALQSPGQVTDPAARVMEVVSSFERSAKPEDDYFEYSDALSLETSSIVATKGGQDTYLGKAKPPMAIDEAYVLKKCRYIFFSWYCNTNLYSVFPLQSATDGPAYIMTIDLYDLTKNNDHRSFKSGQKKNTVDGYTNLYLVLQSGGLVMVYNLGIQSSTQAPKFQSRINEGHKLEYRQLIEKIKRDLNLRSLPF